MFSRNLRFQNNLVIFQHIWIIRKSIKSEKIHLSTYFWKILVCGTISFKTSGILEFFSPAFSNCYSLCKYNNDTYHFSFLIDWQIRWQSWMFSQWGFEICPKDLGHCTLGNFSFSKSNQFKLGAVHKRRRQFGRGGNQSSKWKP